MSNEKKSVPLGIDGIGERIKEQRMIKGISQQNLASEMGVVRQVVSKWETGIQCPDAEYICHLADYFGISCDELILGYPHEHVQIGKETGLSNSVLQRLKYWHHERPEYDEFTEFLLGSTEYWQLNLCVSKIVAAENAVKEIPNIEFGGLMNSITGNMADEIAFEKYKAIQYFSKLIDKYSEGRG